MDRAQGIREGMPVYSTDDRMVGTVERVEGDAIHVNGRPIDTGQIARVGQGRVYLTGVYDELAGGMAATDAARRDRLRSLALIPHRKTSPCPNPASPLPPPSAAPRRASRGARRPSPRSPPAPPSSTSARSTTGSTCPDDRARSGALADRTHPISRPRSAGCRSRSAAAGRTCREWRARGSSPSPG